MKRLTFFSWLLVNVTLVLSFSVIQAQVLTDNPCSLPAGSEFTPGAPCINVSTFGMTPLFNTGTCNSGAYNDGWAWFIGTGSPATITYSNTTGDPIIHIFEADLSTGCLVTEIGCADNTISGGTETVTVPTTAGTIYFIRIQNWISNTATTGCLGIVSCPSSTYNLTDNPCSLPADAQFPTDGVCYTASTCGMSHLFDPASCGSGAFNDGWAWFPGTNSLVDVTFQPAPGEDIIVHAFSDDGTCTVLELDCSNSGGAGVAETVTFSALSGVNYFIRIQSNGNNNELSGCLSITPLPPTCDDLIQNGTETNIDCGGSCPNPCATDNCSNTVNTTMGAVTCNVVGTSAFDSLTHSFSFNGVNTYGAPTPTPACGPNWNGAGNYTSWLTIDLDSGVTSMTLDLSNQLPISASDDVYIAFYQGLDCASLNLLGCETFALNDPISGLILQSFMVQNLDPSLPLYILLYSNDPFSFLATPLGFYGEPSNIDCANAINNSQTGCNVGATGDPSFTPPDAFAAGTCQGGVWSSNENTVYYSFTPTSTNADLQIENILCNNGTSGLAQFAVWESCADVGTYGSAFLGCVVGTGNLSLTGLTVGQTYIIVVDGNAGDICQWEFVGNNILLQMEILSFDVNYENEDVRINWRAKDKGVGDHYHLQRSEDGIQFENITKVDVATGSGNTSNYEYTDNSILKGMYYYRLEYMKLDGTVSYSDIISIEINPLIDTNTPIVYPNPIKLNEAATLYFDATESGVIDVSIFNANGQSVSNTVQTIQQGVNHLQLETEELPIGMYYVTLRSKGYTKEMKLVIK